MRTPGRGGTIVCSDWIHKRQGIGNIGCESNARAAEIDGETIIWSCSRAASRMGYIHADIKPGNVLVTDDFQVKLIDFGMATRIGHAKKYWDLRTRAPELHNMCPGPVDVAIDWWAFGATVAIWYYYHFNHAAHKHANLQNAVLTPQVAKVLWNAFIVWFHPWWNGRRLFHSGNFPSSLCGRWEAPKFLGFVLDNWPVIENFWLGATTKYCPFPRIFQLSSSI